MTEPQKPESIPEKIYSDDELLRYKDTDISPSRRKALIDGVLAEYGVQDVGWRWNKDGIDRNEPCEIFVIFKIDEIINDYPVKSSVRVDAPIIWDRPKPKGRPPILTERVNWRVSMAAMYHFIYTHLNSAHAMRSGKTVAFLGFIQSGKNQQIKDMILPRLKEYQALEEKLPPQRARVIEGELVKQENSNV
jgi:hypothetical protein